MKQETQLFVATKAFINCKSKILIVRESKNYAEGTSSGFFDVVGGRVNPGERFDTCLKREVKEETGLDVRLACPFFVGEWWPFVKGEQWQIVGIFFECFSDSQSVILSNDHDEYKWIDPKNFANENLIAAGRSRFDLRIAFEAYLSRLK